MTLAMIINIIVACLLVITIVYAIILNHNLKKVRDARGELQSITQKFVEASSKANSSVETLQQAANKMETEIRQQIGRGEEIKSDLAFFIKKGDDIAARLEERILSNKEVESVPPQQISSQRADWMQEGSVVQDGVVAGMVKGALQEASRPQKNHSQNNIKSAILKAIQDIKN